MYVREEDPVWKLFGPMSTLAYMFMCFKACLVMASVFHLRLEEVRSCGDEQGINSGPDFPQFSALLCTGFVYGFGASHLNSVSHL